MPSMSCAVTRMAVHTCISMRDAIEDFAFCIEGSERHNWLYSRRRCVLITTRAKSRRRNYNLANNKTAMMHENNPALLVYSGKRPAAFGRA